MPHKVASGRLRRELELNDLASRTEVLLSSLAKAWNIAGKAEGDALMQQHIREFDVKESLRTRGSFGYHFSVLNKGRDWFVDLKADLMLNSLEVTYVKQDERGYLCPVTRKIEESAEDIQRMKFLHMFGISSKEARELLAEQGSK